ncbi:hypothetical protein Tco_0079644 [Tanacetum coccineum]
MDSMIPIGQKNTLTEYMILSGADNCPPMLDKDLVAQGSMGKKFTTNARSSLTKAGKDLLAVSNDMNIYKMKLEQFQVNTKFLNSLPPEWSMFVTDVKLVKDLHTTKFDQLHAYLQQHKLHANEVRIMRERNHDPLIDSGLAVLVFKKGDDPIDAINKMMSFLANISGMGGNNLGQQRIVKCFNCQGECHMTRQYPKPKRKRDATWFRDKVLLVEAQGNGKVLNEEELEFLANPGVTKVLMANLSSYGSDVLSEVPHSENTHTDMLNQSVQEMSYSEQTHLVNYPENEITSDSNIIPYSQYLLETQNAAVQDTNSSAQQDAMILSVFEQLSNQVTNCNKVNKDNLIANESLSAELERYKERVKLLEERQNVDLSTREKLIMDDIIREKNAQFADFEKEINYLKQTLSEQSKEKELLTKTFNVFKNESKEKEAKNIDKEIALEKKVKELDNIVCKMGQSAQTVHMLTKPQVFYDNNLKQALGFQNPFYLKKAQQIRPMLYDGSVIAKETNVISIADSEETLMLEEESRSKMLLKQSDPMVLEKKVNIKPINYAELNRLFEDFGLGDENTDVPQRSMASRVFENPSLGSDSNTSINDQVAAIMEIQDVETLFRVKFTSQNDIDVFSMSIKEGKYADILSTMSTTDIDAVVNAIETIRKKFQDEVNNAAGTQLRSIPMMRNSSPLVSSSTIISVPYELNIIDVVATFGVPLTTVGDLHKLINDIEVGKHDELLSGLTNDDLMVTLDALVSICNSIQANRNNAYVIPCKVSHADDSINLNVDESTIPSNPIVQSLSINTKSTSYAGAAGVSAKDQPNANSNFRTLVADPVFDGVNVSIPRKVFKKELQVKIDKTALIEQSIKSPIGTGQLRAACCLFANPGVVTPGRHAILTDAAPYPGLRLWGEDLKQIKYNFFPYLQGSGDPGEARHTDRCGSIPWIEALGRRFKTNKIQLLPLPPGEVSRREGGPRSIPCLGLCSEPGITMLFVAQIIDEIRALKLCFKDAHVGYPAEVEKRQNV